MFISKFGLLPVSILVLSCTIAKADPPAGVNWKLVWSDEFNGNKLDRTKWDYRTGTRNDALWVTEAVTPDRKGHLVLRCWDKNGQAYGGAITSFKHFHHRYGYYETRCRLPKYIGHWGAFWLQTPTQGLAPYVPRVVGSEVDIFEYIEPGSDIISHNVHWGCNSDFYEHTGNDPEVPGLSNGEFHTFGLLWTPEEYVFYVDNKETWRTGTGISHHDLYVIFSDEILFKSAVKQGELPKDFRLKDDFFTLDYVRVYDFPDEPIPPLKKDGDYLQILEIQTDENGARLLRSGVGPHLLQVAGRPETQTRRLPILAFTETGKAENRDNISGTLEVRHQSDSDTRYILHLKMETNKQVGWQTDPAGKKTPVMRFDRAQTSRQLINPDTWYILADRPAINTAGRSFILYRVITIGNGSVKRTTHPSP